MTKNKLIDLYQKTAEDSGEEVERLRSAVHEMKAAIMPISEGALKLMINIICVYKVVKFNSSCLF